jgi:hypothetical protein
VRRIVGAEDRWVVRPDNQIMRVAGSGDFWWSEWSMTYPDGQEYRVVDLFELRSGLILRETVYWAPPFAAPDWRRPFVDLLAVRWMKKRALRYEVKDGIGTLTLEDGTAVKGFLCEALATMGAPEITSFGGWRAFIAAKS